MKETTPRNQRVYLKVTDVGHGMMRLAASLTPPAYDEPMMVLLSRGTLPSGQPLSFLLISDPSQDDSLRGKAATVTVGAVTAGAPGSAPQIANSGTDSAAVLDFTLPAPRDGNDGQSAYQLARQQGYGGTLTAWLASLTGAAGASAYEIARAAGYGGTQTQWLTTLVGAAGLSAYDVAKAAGFVGTQAQWLASLKGAPASALLGTVVVGQTATIAIVAGVRRLVVTIPAALGVAASDSLVLCPTQALAGYALHDVVAVSATSLSIGLTGPALAINASFSISCKLFRLNP